MTSALCTANGVREPVIRIGVMAYRLQSQEARLSKEARLFAASSVRLLPLRHAALASYRTSTRLSSKGLFL
jgi:hypothetical protein